MEHQSMLEEPSGVQREVAKSGVMIIELGNDERAYKCPCDICGTVEQVKFLPKVDRAFYCNACQKVKKQGKPSTRVTKRHGNTVYMTQCDRCGKEQESLFLPLAKRSFLCNECYRKEPQREEGPLKRGVQVLGNRETPRYLVPCDRCRIKVQVKFAPREGESFFCGACYAAGTLAAEVRSGKKKAETRVFFNIECTSCGKHETVDFVPTSPSQQLCKACFEKQRRKR